MIGITSRGDDKKTRAALERLMRGDIFSDLDKYGKMGVQALSAATPIDTGMAAHSWGYRVIKDKRAPGIEWYNTDVENGVNVVILIQYGHATRSGSYVPGRDFINPTMKPIFDQITEDVWKKVRQ